jgi:hypothetical protein
VYKPATGQVFLKHLRSLDGAAIASREQQYFRTMKQQSHGNEVELF